MRSTLPYASSQSNGAVQLDPKMARAATFPLVSKPCPPYSVVIVLHRTGCWSNISTNNILLVLARIRELKKLALLLAYARVA